MEGDPAHVKVHAPPGGKSNFSLSWGHEPDAPKAPAAPPAEEKEKEVEKSEEEEKKAAEHAAGLSSGGAEKSSVKVHAPPGGKSSITF